MPTKKLSPRIKEASCVVPSERQLAWQELEFYAFVHFGINTFSNSEWGTGAEDPAIFNPEKLDCRQWAKVFRAAGMRGMLLTAKHHDGFCLWPTTQTEHCVRNSPWKGGKGDVVREAADACREAGLQFGLYLSPWDLHEPTYGTGDAYNEFYKRQLRELLTNYGKLFCVWFDGACGEGKNGKKQAYAWQEYYDLIRELQPEAVISISGPDVRWVGNEGGICRSSEWSVVPKVIKNETYWDLGSRKALQKSKAPLVWYPAEVDVSIRPGWFYHEKENYGVKPLAKLREIYYKSVGANAAFLLNVPPTPEGLLHTRDIETLISLGAQLKIDFKENLAEGCAPVSQPAKKPTYVLDLGDDYDINKILLQEDIAKGQQIEKFTLYFDKNTGAEGVPSWKKLAQGTVIGHKRIVSFREFRVRRFKLVIESHRGPVELKSWEAY